MNSQNLVAIPGFNQDHLCGACVAWSLKGETPVNVLSGQLTSLGISEDAQPQPASQAVALKRAMSSVTGPRRLLRKIDGGTWALVDEDVVDADLAHHTILKARLGDNGPVFTPANTGPETFALMEDVQAEYHRQVAGFLSTWDLSSWLIQIAQGMSALALRSSGGFYFLPPSAMTLWRGIAKVIRANGHEMIEIPTVKTEEVLDIVAAAMTSEADTEVQKIDDFLLKDVGSRAIRGRQQLADEAIQKVMQYEALLGRQMDGVQAKLNALRGRLMAAVLEAEAAEEDERAAKKAAKRAA